MDDGPGVSEVDAFVERAKQWKAEFAALRDLLRGFDLREDYKWEKPCYSLKGQNVVLIHGFKDYCALLFFKGALLKDHAGLLIQQTENVQAARQLRFAGLEEIIRQNNLIRACVAEAIEVEKAGLKVAFKAVEAFDVPDEFAAALGARPELKAAFEALTPGRRKGYLLHFGSAKQSATRVARIEKVTPRILAGKGLDD